MSVKRKGEMRRSVPTHSAGTKANFRIGRVRLGKSTELNTSTDNDECFRRKCAEFYLCIMIGSNLEIAHSFKAYTLRRRKIHFDQFTTVALSEFIFIAHNVVPWVVKKPLEHSEMRMGLTGSECAAITIIKSVPLDFDPIRCPFFRAIISRPFFFHPSISSPLLLMMFPYSFSSAIRPHSVSSRSSSTFSSRNFTQSDTEAEEEKKFQKRIVHRRDVLTPSRIKWDWDRKEMLASCSTPKSSQEDLLGRRFRLLDETSVYFRPQPLHQQQRNGDKQRQKRGKWQQKQQNQIDDYFNAIRRRNPCGRRRDFKMAEINKTPTNQMPKHLRTVKRHSKMMERTFLEFEFDHLGEMEMPLEEQQQRDEEKCSSPILLDFRRNSAGSDEMENIPAPSPPLSADGHCRPMLSPKLSPRANGTLANLSPSGGGRHNSVLRRIRMKNKMRRETVLKRRTNSDQCEDEQQQKYTNLPVGGQIGEGNRRRNSSDQQKNEEQQQRQGEEEKAVKDISRFIKSGKKQRLRTLVKKWLEVIDLRNVTFVEFTNKAGLEVLRRSIKVFSRQSFNESDVFHMKTSISWLSNTHLCFRPVFLDQESFKPIEDQGTFFIMILMQDTKMFTDKTNSECISVDFHGRPTTTVRNMEGKGRVKDGISEELCAGQMHELTVESEFDCRLRCRMKMIREICHCTPQTLRYLSDEQSVEEYPICDYEKCDISESQNVTDQKCAQSCVPHCAQVRYLLNHNQQRAKNPAVTSLKLIWGAFEYLELEQSYVWSLWTFIAAIGGSIGMWLGLSMLSLIQLIVFFTDQTAQMTAPPHYSAF